ncbi:hypothetical protein LPJ75_001982 [Coemansia sp. RSA 2598]|nr:hypothetical protein LPJ75_001982 [Coemansia sp. RSA 2598]
MSSYGQQVPDLLHRNGGFADAVPSGPYHQGTKDRGKPVFTRLQLIDQDQAFS